MCGICGQFNFEDNSLVNQKDIESMMKAIAHRGPDDEGYYVSGSLGLGFRRLSIIDLQSGHQPMCDEEKTIWTVFNGEIYNFPELKRELGGYGHTFKTTSDTEVIIYGYKQWGIDVLERLNGMFGLAIWDEEKKTLVLARDKMGIKPLYYKVESGCLCFGSEIRAILACENEKPEIDPQAICLFLRYRYIPSPLTLFKGVKKLAAGTRLIVERSEPRVERWWGFHPTPFDPMPSLQQAEDKLLELYKRAVKRQMISDVPLGLFLSGGLDSGLLLALMRQSEETSRTFTVGFGSDYEKDELIAARETARALNASNVAIQIDRETFDKILPKVISVLEEPIAASSVVPMYYLCQLARQNVKVALMGQGPDELFGGYIRHLGVHYGHYWRSLPYWIRASLGALSSHLPRNESVRRALYSLDIPNRLSRYQQVFSILPDDLVEDLFQDGALPPAPGDKVLECWQDLLPLMENADELGGFQFLEIRSSLPDELLMYADKLGMAHGLEIRVPYLDQEIVEYVERLPASYKVRDGSGKWLHRRVCSKFLPKNIVKRRKIGFQTPVNEWFRSSLAGKMEDTLLDNDSLIYKYLSAEAVQRLVREHRNNQRDHQKILFSLIVVEELLRNYVA